MANPFHSLHHKNFRYFWFGMWISTTGTWMQNIAQPWLAYSLTKSPFLLSLVGAMQFLPVLLFSLFAGVIVDRFPKKRILVITQSVSMGITMALAILTLTGTVRYWHILMFATLLGFVNTLDMPARQSFVIELVGKDDLMNAIALNSMVFNLSRIIGPVIAGIIMAYLHVGVCFLINSLSFGAIVINLIFIKPEFAAKVHTQKVRLLEEIKEGVKYIIGKKILLITIFIVAIVGTFAPNFGVLVPVFSTMILNEHETGFGLLMSFLGVGSFLGALTVAMLSRKGPQKFVLLIVPLIVGAFLILVGFTNLFAVTGIGLALTGFFFIIFVSTANSTLQLNTDSEHRGRVMSFYALVFAGSTPIGNLYAGTIMQKFNARAGFFACGAIIILLMIPIYLYLIKREKNKTT